MVALLKVWRFLSSAVVECIPALHEAVRSTWWHMFSGALTMVLRAPAGLIFDTVPKLIHHNIPSVTQ